MITSCARSAWRAASRHGRLILIVWAWNAAFAAIAGLATWRWLDAAFAYAPEADKLLERFRIGVAIELMQYDRFAPLTALNGTILGLMLLAAISNPLLAAGVLEGLVADDGRPLLHRFLRGAGHFFGRFFRLLIISAVAGLVLFLVMAALTRPIVSSLSETSWERTWIVATLLRMCLLGATVGVVAVVLDVARAQVLTSALEVRGMLRAWLGAARHVMRHIGAAAVLAFAYVGVFAVLLATYGLVTSVVPARTWAGILVTLLLQQAFMVGRAGLRVARAGAAVQFSQSQKDIAAPALQHP